MAVGMQRASHSAIGLPRRSTSASWMLVFLMPAEVSSSFMIPLRDDAMGADKRLRFPLLRGTGYMLAVTPTIAGRQPVRSPLLAACRIRHAAQPQEPRCAFSYVSQCRAMHGD